MVVADVDGNGYGDIITANAFGSNIKILLNSDNGPLNNQIVLSSSNAVGFVTAEDINSDGKVDIIVMNEYINNTGLFFNNGDGTFTTEVILTIESAPDDITVADINEDNHKDIIVAYRDTRHNCYLSQQW